MDNYKKLLAGYNRKATHTKLIEFIIACTRPMHAQVRTNLRMKKGVGHKIQH